MALTQDYTREANYEFHLLYYVLGRAIAQWASVERGMYWLLCESLPTTSRQDIEIIFFSVVNFQSKLEVLDNVVRPKLATDNLKEKWTELNERLGKLSSQRNKMAHYPANFSESGRTGRRVGLEPSLKRQLKFKSRTRQLQPGSIFIRDIDLYERQFRSLLFDLALFAEHLRTLKPPKEYPTPPDRLRTISEIEAQMHQGLQVQRLPSGA